MDNIKLVPYTDENEKALRQFIEEYIFTDKDENCDSLRDHCYENIFDEDGSKTIMICHNNEIIGVGTAKKFDNYLQHKIFPELHNDYYNAYELCNYYIRKDFRGRGLQHKLTKALEAMLPESEAFSAAIMKTNQISIHNCKKDGYKYICDGQLDWFYDGKVRELVLLMKVK